MKSACLKVSPLSNLGGAGVVVGVVDVPKVTFCGRAFVFLGSQTKKQVHIVGVKKSGKGRFLSLEL